MSELELTDIEKKAIKGGLEDAEEDIAGDLLKAKEAWGDELKRRFEPHADCRGLTEAMDRAWIQFEIWEHYVVSHPSVLLMPGAYRMAKLASALMHETYQMLGRYDVPKSELPQENP
jgi:hypothetical protein